MINLETSKGHWNVFDLPHDELERGCHEVERFTLYLIR
jgi:hypothetical protein